MNTRAQPLTAAEFEATKIIVVHIPKAGGSSIYWLSRDALGEDKVLRFGHRQADGGTKTFDDLTAEEREQHRVFQGHFRYGSHRLFSQRCLYVGVVRDPIDRLVSNYYYNRARGNPGPREKALSLGLRDYVEDFLSGKKPAFGSGQMHYLTGERVLKNAKSVVEDDYILAGTTEQLNDLQRSLLRLYQREDLQPTRRNVTDSQQQASAEDRAYLQETYRDFFKGDLAFVDFVAGHFERHGKDLRLAD
ncbi:MAG: sulfotransferase domain-containing protein [Pseudomonadota bacterium]